jgi:hypothetical protein
MMPPDLTHGATPMNLRRKLRIGGPSTIHRRRRFGLALCQACALVLIFAFSASLPFGQNADAADLGDSLLDDYRPGQGFHIPGTGLSVGGYLTGEYAEHQSPAVTVNNASLLFWYENDTRLKLFSEVDFQQGLNRQGSYESQHGSFLALERLYADYALLDTLTVRVGKYLTPIGRWNLIHADPLVWTTSRPLVTDAAFPTNATGVMLLGSSSVGGFAYDYSVYAAQGNDLDPTPNIDPFKHAVGARLNVNLSDRLQVGGSLASFQQASDRAQNRNLVGADFLYQRNGFELSSEAIYRLSEHNPSGNDKGLYLQGVAPVANRLFLVYRYEIFHSADVVPGGPPRPVAMMMGQDGEMMQPPVPIPIGGYSPPPPTVTLNVLGLTYRFRPNLVGKIEFVDGHFGSIPVPVGVLSSVSLLF